LALFRRRPPERVEGSSPPASENLHRSGHLGEGIVMDRLMEPLGERLTARKSPPPGAG